MDRQSLLTRVVVDKIVDQSIALFRKWSPIGEEEFSLLVVDSERKRLHYRDSFEPSEEPKELLRDISLKKAMNSAFLSGGNVEVEGGLACAFYSPHFVVAVFNENQHGKMLAALVGNTLNLHLQREERIARTSTA